MNETTITCSKCNRTFKRKKNFENHDKICIGNQCQHCNEIFLDSIHLNKHTQICVNRYINENTNLNSELNSKNIKIKELEDQIVNLKNDLKQDRKKYSKYENISENYNDAQKLISKLQSDLTNKDKEISNFEKEISKLKAIEDVNNKRIEDLKQSKPTIIHNNNNSDNRITTNQFANNINNATLIKSPDSIIDNLDTKTLLQSNKFKNEEDFADYWHKTGLTKTIQVIDRSRYKTKYIDKNSNVIEDTNCSLLANKIYTSTTESAKEFTKDYVSKMRDIHEDEIYGQRDRNKEMQKLNESKDLAFNIITKNKKSLDRFGKLLVKYADYNIKKLIDQNKDKSKFITKLISIINNKNCGIFWNDFIHIGQQLRSYLKNDIVYFEPDSHILVKDDSDVNVKIDSEFFLTFLVEMLREKSKEVFINDQLKILLGNKYDNYANVYKMANFFFEEQTSESLTKAKQDILFGLSV
jgi:predicted  nucleic acid-binding Zn-ribbon protein